MPIGYSGRSVDSEAEMGMTPSSRVALIRGCAVLLLLVIPTIVGSQQPTISDRMGARH